MYTSLFLLLPHSQARSHSPSHAPTLPHSTSPTHSQAPSLSPAVWAFPGHSPVHSCVVQLQPPGSAVVLVANGRARFSGVQHMPTTPRPPATATYTHRRAKTPTTIPTRRLNRHPAPFMPPPSHHPKITIVIPVPQPYNTNTPAPNRSGHPHNQRSQQ